MATNPYTIKSSPILLICYFIRTSIYISLLGLMVYVLSSKFLPISINMDSAKIYACLAVVGIVSIFITFFLKNIKIEVTEDTLAIIRGGKLLHVFNRNHTLFSSFVENHSINYIPTHSDRYLRAIGTDKEEQILLPNISAKTFSSLMAVITRSDLQISVEQSTKEETISENSATTFTIPKAQFIGHLTKIRNIATIVLIILAIAFTAWYTRLAINTPTMMSPMSAFITSLTFGLVFTFSIMIPVLISQAKIKRQVPETITIQTDGLKIDSTTYPYSQIIQINMTPPEYGNGNFETKRYLAITTSQKKTTYNLGSRQDELYNVMTYPDYKPLCEALRTTCQSKKINFTYDLS